MIERLVPNSTASAANRLGSAAIEPRIRAARLTLRDISEAPVASQPTARKSARMLTTDEDRDARDEHVVDADRGAPRSLIGPRACSLSCGL